MNEKNTSSKTGFFSALQIVLLEVLLALGLMAALALFYNSLIFSRVQGRTMEPTYKNSDFLLCKRSAAVNRQDIVYFRAEGAMRGDRETDASLRRVIGLPGDRVEILPEGSVTVNGDRLEEAYLAPEQVPATCRPGPQSWVLGEDEYFVLGDARDMAVDSRDYGPISGNRILGRALGQPNITVYILTVIAPLCGALVLFWLADWTLRRMKRK